MDEDDEKKPTDADLADAGTTDETEEADTLVEEDQEQDILDKELEEDMESSESEDTELENEDEEEIGPEKPGYGSDYLEDYEEPGEAVTPGD